MSDGSQEADLRERLGRTTPPNAAIVPGGARPARDVTAVATVVSALQSPEPGARIDALERLRKEHPDLLGLARVALDDPDDAVRALATAVLAGAGSTAVGDLAGQLADDRFPHTRRVALAALESLVTPSLEVAEMLALLDGLERLADEPEPAAAAALRRLGTVLTAERLAPWQGRYPRAWSLLAEQRPLLVEDVAPAPGVPTSAAEDTASDVVRSLATALEDESVTVREQAVLALRHLDRTTVAGWARRGLQTGSAHDVGLAIEVARALRLTELAPEVLAAAADPARREGNAALELLGEWDDDGRTTIDHVKQVPPSRRHEALRLAWRLRGPSILPFAGELLTDSAGPVRTAALEVLAHGSSDAAMEAATSTLTSDSSPSVRTTAVKILGGLPGEARAQALQRALADPDPDVRATAVEVLLQRPAGGRPLEDADAALVLHALGDPEERVWRSTVEQLAAVADTLPGLVWEALRRGPGHTRAQLLSLLEVRRPEPLDELALDQLRSVDTDDRVLAVRLIGLVGSAEGVQRVIEALNDPSAVVRRAAADELSGLRSPEAVPALRGALLDPDHTVRVAAVAALGVIDDDTVIPALVGALTDPNDQVRRRAATVIARWSSPSVARALVGFLIRAQLDESAVDLLLGMGPAAVEPLMEALAGADDELVPVLGRVLERVVGLDALLEQARSLDPQARLRAVEGVGAVGGDRALEALVAALGDPHVPVRLTALRSLARIDDSRALNAIRACRTMDPVAEVVAAADEVLLARVTPAPAIDLVDPPFGGEVRT